jgi:hypothetical protein
MPEVVRRRILLYLTRMDIERRIEFWKRFPGLVWSNPDASDTVMIRAALARPKTDRLQQIVHEFGIERVRAEWDILVDDPLKPYSATHISVCNRILAQIEAELEHAY